MSPYLVRVVGRFFAVAALTAASWLAVPVTGHAQQVVVLVDGEPITALDVEQRTKLIQMSSQKPPPRQEVLDGLIDETLEIREASRFSIDVPQSEVDHSYAEIAGRMGQDPQKLDQILEKTGASAQTLKRRLRAQIAWSTLVRGRYKASLEIGDSDIEAQLALHKPDQKNQVGYEYTLRPIVLVVPRGSPDAAFETRKRDADALRVRFLTCAEGIPFARALREVAVREPLTKFSADLVPELRDILDNTDIGHLTPPEQTPEGIQMFALCGKKETQSDTPGKKQVREELFQQKFGVQAKRYLAELRRQAMIEYK